MHSSYNLPESRRAIEKDPYKLALIEKISPCPTVETLILDLGEEIMENALQTAEIKRANDPEEKWE